MAKGKTKGWHEGTVYWDESRGEWVNEVTIDGRRYRSRGKDKTAARARLAKRVRELEQDGPTTDRKVTVAVAVERFLTLAVPNRSGGNLAPSTRASHRWACQLIVAGLGTKRLHSLTVRQVEDFLMTLVVSRPLKGQGQSSRRKVTASAPLSRASLVKVRSTLSMVLDDARRRGDLAHNVAKIAHLPVDAPRAVERRSLTPDEARTLLRALQDEPNGAMYALMLRIGLRPGEAAGLHWSSLSGRDLTVSRGLQVAPGGARVVDNLKTASSRRTIELPDDLVSWLAQHRRQQAAERLAAESWANEALMFTSPVTHLKAARGHVVDAHASRKALAGLCQRLGITVVTPNELRHSCASLLADEGVRNEDIADLLGHTTTRMVERTYRHRIRQSVDVARRATWATGT